MRTTIKVEIGKPVLVQGFEFIPEEITDATFNGRPAVYFIGRCTSNTINDPIRHTGYDGGYYGGTNFSR